MNFGLNLTAELVVVSLFTFGEEIGWRGYLLPRFSNLKPVQAMLLVSFLHGVWHLSVLLMTSEYHSEGNPLIIVPLFLLTLTATGVYYGYLRLTTRSVWPVVLAHSALNAFWEALNGLSVVSSPLATEYLAGESGVLTLLGVVLAAVWLVSRLRGHCPSPQEPRTA